MHFLRRLYVYSTSAADPAQSAHPKHISHTNTHLSHCSGPLHHRRVGLALLQRPALLGEDKQILRFPRNLQSSLPPTP